MARDIFMLTYYLGGINLRDLMEYDFTKGNCMRYIRHKTRNSKKNENEIAFTISQKHRQLLNDIFLKMGSGFLANMNLMKKVYSLVF